MEANKEAAADALARARQKYAAADDAGALQWAEKSLKLYRTTEAAKLQQEIREFGDGSENAALVRRVLASRDHFEALSALPGETELARGPHFDGAEASKRWKRLSKALHPDKNRARDADEAQKRVNLANDVLKDAAARHKYELTLPPRTRGGGGGGAGRRGPRRRTGRRRRSTRATTRRTARARRRRRAAPSARPPRRTSARARRRRRARRRTRTERTVGPRQSRAARSRRRRCRSSRTRGSRRWSARRGATSCRGGGPAERGTRGGAAAHERGAARGGRARRAPPPPSATPPARAMRSSAPNRLTRAS